jgi:hypothetical protein
MQLSRTAVWLAGVIAPAAAVAQTVNLPTLDCTVDFVSLQAVVQALPGAERGEDGGFVTVKLAEPDVWRVEYGFTTRWHPAYPAATLRTFRKQVTGVWTAQSKVCGYGNADQLSALMAEMKSGDKKLTDASRDEVERGKQSRSPLAPAH